MDKIDKYFSIVLFVLFSVFFLDKIIDTLRESNAMLLTEALNTSPGFIVSVVGYNEFYIVGTSILFGFISALIGVKLSQKV